VWNYLEYYNVPYSEIYNKGYDRTGCMFCLFGLHYEGVVDRFDKMRITHPKMYDYCMEELKLQEVLQWYPYRGSRKRQKLL
jgi:3'-phosphoadenosine 5'-phosphosulfate sulfotransferase (PAPS reductase)/FAD synthetase